MRRGKAMLVVEHLVAPLHVGTLGKSDELILRPIGQKAEPTDPESTQTRRN